MKVAIIGTGRMGRRHVEAVRRLGLALVGVCDISPESLELARTEQGVPSELHFSDVALMLDRTHPDCVIVATTAPSHCDYACLAAEAGARFILVEKPMAVSLAQCDRMIEVCARRGARLAVNHPTRFMPRSIEPKRLVTLRDFGGLASVTVIAGNVGMAMNGTHFVEMFRFMTGEDPIEVTAWFSPENVPNPRGEEYEDRAGSLRVTTASGKRLYVEIGADQGHGLQVVYAGRFGRLSVDELAGTMTLVVREAEYRDLPTTRYGMPASVSEHHIGAADVVSAACAVLESLFDGSSFPSGEDGRRAVEVLVAAYQSAENGNMPVKLGSAPLPRDRVFPWA